MRLEDDTLDESINPSAVNSEKLSPGLGLIMEASRPLAEPLRLDLTNISEIAIARMGQSEQRTCERHGENRLLLHIPDRLISRDTHAIISRDAAGQWRIRDMGSKNGVSVNGVRVRELPLVEDALLEIGATYFYFRVRASARHPRYLFDPPSTLTTLNTLLAANFRRIRELAPSMIPVLIRGETGTGKEVVARAVHELSGREGRLVAVNCGAVPSSIIESELFGCVKGAYSGASRDRPGLIRAAHGGTLFLDEIAELGLPAQVALLRVLQEREVLPVGASTPIPVDVRIIAATHQDLPARVESKAFRQDLYGRLDGFNLVLPALRNRREDIGILVGALLRRMCGTDADDITLQRSAARALFDYDWPQNIRELEQAIRYAVSLASNQTIQLEHLPEKLRKKATPTNALSEDHLLQRAHLTELLTKHRGNVSAVAREMGRQRVSVHRWLKRFGISPKPFRV